MASGMSRSTSSSSIADPNAPVEQFSPKQFVEALHAAFGSHHVRAVHAKGIILEGTFTPDPQAATLTVAPHLQNTPSTVIVRFSDFTGLPDIPDNADAANPRGFAIRFTLPDGMNTDIVGHSFDGFPTASSNQFHELLMALAASGPGAAKPTALDKFLESHPVAKTFLTTQNTPASYGTIMYFGVNAFQFTNKAGASHYVRYQFVPDGGEQLLTAGQAKQESANYLQDEIKTRIAKGPIRFTLYAQLAEAGDKYDDPSIAWPASRKRVPLGVITIAKLGANTPEQDKATAFLPNNVPVGIKPADPMIELRSRAYPISAEERRRYT